MSFFHSAIGVLQTLVIALGAGLAIWGAINHRAHKEAVLNTKALR